ncbi:sigma-70 family RNA polymerase sigma factor [Arcicella sp. LKC2W]|uniref:RNA polymerase sigma factor n=1 Tax=Arcicella sp. LKC2W TaxID=2984198 RepID=UPI002B20D006|nr:sigma-70 family RNA polymerase sigma factor [Arcicella sp. LKC2W]MEA5461693.1 sigma-70 family RNA polymerase sigma factor [Arcicella sp. LKC2W]
MVVTPNGGLTTNLIEKNMREFSSDSDVLEALLSTQNSNSAISFLYKNNYYILENLVLKNGGNKMDAEDVIQETMITFIEMVRSGKFRGDSAIKSILYAISKNIWITKFRKTTQDNKRIEGYILENESFESDITEQIQKTEANKIIGQVFDKIGDSCKKILTFYYYDNLSFKEILGKTDYENEQVIRNKKYKCMKSLMDILESSPSLSSSFKSSLFNQK